MSNILLASNNAVDSGATWYGDQDSSPFVLTQLADPNFSKIWRKTPSTNADGNTVKFHVSLGTIARLNHLALCRHNLSEAAQIRVRAGTARLDVDFTDDAGLTSPYITFGGGTNGTRTNEYGVMVSGTCPRYEHDRRYFANGFASSENMGPGYWGTAGAFCYPDGLTMAFEYAGAITYQPLTALQSLNADTYEMKAQVRLVSGDGNFNFRLFNGNVFIDGARFTATPDWQWFSSPIVSPASSVAANAYGYIQKAVAAGVLQIRRVQIYRGSSGGKYWKTTTQRRYQRIGIITEGSNTNNLLRSSELDNAVWARSVVTVTANTSVAPDGTTSMDRISGGPGYIAQDVAMGGTTVRAGSVIFRSDASTSTSAVFYLVWDGVVSQFVYVSFNPSTGAVIGSGVVGASLLAFGVKDLGNGFYRAYVIGQGSNASNTICRTQLATNDTGTLTAWGAQQESTFVTSYIPTTSAAVTRSVDTAVVEPTTWVPYAWNAAEGTVYHEVMADDIPADVPFREIQRIEVSGAGTNIIRSHIFENAGVYAAMNLYLAGVLTANLQSIALARSTAHRLATRYRASDYAFVVNGTVVGTSTAAAVPAITSIDLMYSPNVTGYLRRVTIWPTGKSNADLQALTTSGPSAIDYDSGWSDALQMTPYTQLPALWGYDYDIIKSFTDRAAEWIRVGIYDPAKTSSSTPFEIGRLFTGKVKMQPGVNPSYGLSDGWDDATTYAQTQSRRRIFNVLPKLRQVAFELGKLSLSEGDAAHEFDGTNGLSTEVLYLPDPSDEAKCQRYGFVGLMETLDALRWPLMNLRSKAYQITDKR
jgi:hypothetical protein